MKIFLHYILPLIIILIGLYLQTINFKNEYYPFMRSGAILVIIGIIIEMEYTVRNGSEGTVTRGSTTIIPKDSILPKKTFKEWLEHIGIAWIIIGTLIWGFGDIPYMI